MSDLIDAIPALARLRGARRDTVRSCIDAKLDKLAFKLERAPYEPYRRHDPLGVNRDIRGAVGAWMNQFPERVRLGALAVAVGAVYVTHHELDELVDVAIGRLVDSLTDGSPTSVPRRLRPYPVSVFGAYDRFIHRLRIEGTKDRSARPVHGLLDEFTGHVLGALVPLARHGLDGPDSQAHVNVLRQVVRSLVGADVVVLEEAAYSGYTLAAGLRRLLRLLDILFARTAVRSPAVIPPRVSVVCLLATGAALRTVEEASATGRGLVRRPIAACVLDDRQRLGRGLPDTLLRLDEQMPGRSALRAHITSALRFFHDEYGWRYLGEDTRLRAREEAVGDFTLGFKNGGWTVVSQDNCPNNSVPLLWYPHGSSVEARIQALFQRVESRVAHEVRASQLDAAIGAIEEAGRDRLAHALRPVFEDVDAAAVR